MDGNREYTRQFHTKIYYCNCICGCDVRNSLLCLHFLPFGNNDAFNKTGVKDLGHLKSLLKAHSENKRHINNVLDLTMLDSINIATKLSRAYKDSILKTINTEPHFIYNNWLHKILSRFWTRTASTEKIWRFGYPWHVLIALWFCW